MVTVGVPTVVDAATLVNDTMEKMLGALAAALPPGDPFYNMLEDMESADRHGLITDILDPATGNMFVTPKEVDAVIGRLSKIIADTLNIALHPGITPRDVNRYIEPM